MLAFAFCVTAFAPIHGVLAVAPSSSQSQMSSSNIYNISDFSVDQYSLITATHGRVWSQQALRYTAHL